MLEMSHTIACGASRINLKIPRLADMSDRPGGDIERVLEGTQDREKPRSTGGR